MSAKRRLRALQNRANALGGESPRPYPRNTDSSTSTSGQGPKTDSGKQKSSFNALKHNLTGQSLILQPNEYEAYDRLTRALREELNPKTELERQTVQKIIDTNFRLNRIAGIENNMLNFGLWENQRETESDERLDVMKAQTLAWMERSKSFDLLGRYESRLAKQLLAFTRELERLQSDRRDRERTEALIHPEETKAHHHDLASFGNSGPQLVMSARSAPDSPRGETPPAPQTPHFPPPTDATAGTPRYDEL
jgi:hypothetical protein